MALGLTVMIQTTGLSCFTGSCVRGGKEAFSQRSIETEIVLARRGWTGAAKRERRFPGKAGYGWNLWRSSKPLG
jgi:hypothetical protein